MIESLCFIRSQIVNDLPLLFFPVMKKDSL